MRKFMVRISRTEEFKVDVELTDEEIAAAKEQGLDAFSAASEAAIEKLNNADNDGLWYDGTTDRRVDEVDEV